ncbi:MAG: hypothetical protein IJV67_01365, partial [Clostridia bacterium]|nr:hypothetical protein [Clostridia bacterium]
MKVFSKIIGLLMAITLGCFASCAGGGGNPSDNVNIKDLVDFVVEIEEDRDFTVLQLSDPQIIDAAQKRTENRLGTNLNEYWA